MLLIFLLSGFYLFSQDLQTTEIKVNEQFDPSIPDASRLNQQATYADTVQEDRKQSYSLINELITAKIKTRPLKAAKVKPDKIPQLYSTKVSFGIGNAYTTKGIIAYNSKRSRNLSYGILLKHNANKFSPPEITSKNSKNTAHLYAKRITDPYIYILNLNYDRRTSIYVKNNLEHKNYRKNLQIFK